jgi:hypothetical protein
MSPAWTLLFSIMAAIAAVSSASLLYKASLPLLHGKVSFSGQTPFEADFRATRRRYVFRGMGRRSDSGPLLSCRCHRRLSEHLRAFRANQGVSLATNREKSPRGRAGILRQWPRGKGAICERPGRWPGPKKLK